MTSASSQQPTTPPIGVLLTNLGTPDAPTSAALRRYLRQFLSDHRVVEQPRWKWLPILHLFVLTSRPRQSAKLYRKVWTAEGSPLLTVSRSLANGVRQHLASSVATPVEVALGMRYGEPSIAQALATLRERGAYRIVCVPLYPQYSATTTGSTFDALFEALGGCRAVPEVRTVRQYYDDAAYVAALASSIRERWQRDGEPELLLLSFHGIPKRYAAAGDPYPEQCRESARLLAAELGLPAERWRISFQSVFGREEWISPATDATMKQLPAEGIRRVDAVCPGFSADCLETLEEIDQLNREIFLAAGGEQFRYIPCLNDRRDHAAVIGELVRGQLDGWVSLAKR